MDDAVEARTQRVRDHLQRPDHPDRRLTNAKVGSTANRTAPSLHQNQYDLIIIIELPHEAEGYAGQVEADPDR
jgi:hypothetical protein